MPIEFACPSCAKKYRVKDEFAGKPAKCGKCGHRMKVPRPTPPKQKPEPKPMPAPAVETKPVGKSNLGDWLDEELEVAPPVTPTPLPASKCPSCEAPLVGDAVICVVCGYDKRTGEKHATEHVVASEGRKRARGKSKLGTAASLLLGTALSFVGAMIGAAIWAFVVYLTEYEIGWIAWGLGGLAGLGMAIGHDDDDGTLAGIIAGGMSIVGIIAAKVMVVVIFVASIVASVDDELDPVAIQRSMLGFVVAQEQLEEQGIDPDTATDQQWERARELAAADVESMSDEQVTARMEEYAEQSESEAEEMADDRSNQWADQSDEMPGGDEWADPDPGEEFQNEVDGPGLVSTFFTGMFGPIDGIFILLAVVTAYSIGSGKMTD